MSEERPFLPGQLAPRIPEPPKPRMGDLIPVSYEQALEPMIGRIAKIVIGGTEYTAKLSFVGHGQATFKIVPSETKD